ncbi:MAG: nucleoside-diphosphate sugar epimerase/dehydratase, partial [Thermoanaerobaculia bacterium]
MTLKTYIPQRMRNRHLFLLDAASLVAAPVIAFLVRFEDFGWFAYNLRMVLPYILLAAPVRLVVLYNFGMYRRLWKHASIGELKQILAAGGVAAIFSALIGLWLLPAAQISSSRVPFSVVFIDALLATAAIALPRLLARTMRPRSRRRGRAEPGRPALIVGAGDTAKLVAKELIANPALGFEPIGFVDDD